MISICRGSNPAAPTGQSVSNAYGIGSRSKCRERDLRTRSVFSSAMSSVELEDVDLGPKRRAVAHVRCHRLSERSPSLPWVNRLTTSRAGSTSRPTRAAPARTGSSCFLSTTAGRRSFHFGRGGWSSVVLYQQARVNARGPRHPTVTTCGIWSASLSSVRGKRLWAGASFFSAFYLPHKQAHARYCGGSGSQCDDRSSRACSPCGLWPLR